MNIKHKGIFLYAFVLFFVWFHMASAASLTVSPVIIDEKVKARDILPEAVTLVNTVERKLNVYAFVNNVAIQEGKQEFLDPSRADQSSSLANWILISRGVIELKPHETKRIDFKIEVNLRAKPGMYHALISFAEASTRDEAEARIAGSPMLTVNLEVIEDIKERLQLKRFVADKVFFSGFPVSFSYELENIGNRPAIPSGEIRIQDRRGREVASIKINENLAAVELDSHLALSASWQGGGPSGTGGVLAAIGQSLDLKGWGRYKAFLNLEYGSKERGTLQDTVFFWVIPWQFFFIIFGLLIALVITTVFILRNKQMKIRNHEFL